MKLATKLIVLTLDALTPSALGCYGSSWNSTPTIDSLAAGGCLWDRVITSNTDPAKIMQQWLGSSGAATKALIRAWKKHGSVEFLSDSQEAISTAAKCDFDQLYQIDPVGDEMPTEPAAEVEETQFAQLIAAATERINEGDDWSLLWLHSDFLAKCWDAPRWLIDSEPMDEFDEEPMDAAETLEAEMLGAAESSVDSLEELPFVFDTTKPPQEHIGQDAHPDLIPVWMTTYACQVRLVDELLKVLLAAIGDAEVTIVLAGASGESLGQNGWIGHQAGPLRSCHVNVPLIVSKHGPLRVPQLTGEDELTRIIQCLSDEDAPLVTLRDWSREESEASGQRTITHQILSQQAIVTAQWFFVDQGDEGYRLYLKPDDINDFNDISRLRNDVVENFTSESIDF
jgi:arylsulfatase A-like enzyme